MGLGRGVGKRDRGGRRRRGCTLCITPDKYRVKYVLNLQAYTLSRSMLLRSLDYGPCARATHVMRRPIKSYRNHLEQVT